MATGKPVYHLAFGQSPFPVVEAAQNALKEHVHKKEYEPVAGTQPVALLPRARIRSKGLSDRVGVHMYIYVYNKIAKSGHLGT